MSIQGFNQDFELIRQALGSIEFFREMYASTEPSATNSQAVIDALHLKAANIKESNPRASALYVNVAIGLEQYIGLKPLNP